MTDITPQAAVSLPTSPAKISRKPTIKKVVLIQPPAFCNNAMADMNPNAPLGIAYIAGVLEKAGYEVKILDAFIEGWTTHSRISPTKLLVGLPYDEIGRWIKAENPDVVGITSMFTSQRKNAHKVAALAKEVCQDITVIFGGAHATAAPDSVLADPNVDFAVLGEGDNTIVPLLKCVEEAGDLAQVDGIVYRAGDGQLVHQAKTSQIEDLDTIPFPARHLLPMEKYFAAGVRHGGAGFGKRAASMITSRGCQYYCNFCTAFKVFTRKPRMRSIENVLAELDVLVNQYGVDEVFFEDDQIIAKQRRAGELFDAMAERYKLMWDTPNGVSPWLLDEQIIAKMAASGCRNVNLAIESGNQWVLDKLINKPVKLAQVPGLVKTIRKYGMEVGTFLVIGNIGKGGQVETVAQIRESFRFCRKMRVVPHWSLLTAYPGSEVLEIAMEKGYLIPGFDWDDLIIQKSQMQTSQWTPAELARLARWEQMKTRWWIFLTSPVKGFSKFGRLFVQDPIQALTRLVVFFRASVSHGRFDTPLFP